MEGVLKQLKKSSNTAVYNALVYIRKKSLKEANGVAIMRESGVLKLILYHIQNPDEKVVDIALSVLGNCCLEEETRKLVREWDGISFAARNLESSKNESILNRSCRVLANLAIDEINGDEIHRKNVVQRLIEILPAAKDVNYLQSALRALRLFSTAPRHREAVIKLGGVDCLGKLLIQTNSETSEYVILGILKALSTLSEDSQLWTIKSEYVEALVSKISDPKVLIQDIVLNIFSNLSKEPSFRPVLGNAGIIPELIKKVDLWESNSSSWQFAVDCFCQCTRDAVNRAKVRQQGGLKILIRLLKSENDTVWHRGLASLINFEYDETSFSSLVELGMVDALLIKFKHLASTEEQDEHRDDEPSTDLYFGLHDENHEETMDIFPALSSNDRCDHHASPRSECYSPECSPPYCTQFLPHSPIIQPSHGYSPGRSISPDLSEQHGEIPLCYSPVYEWDVSDESDSEVSSTKATEDVTNSTVEIEEEISRTQETPVDDCKDELATATDSSGRSPLSDILMIFSRLSLRENVTAIFLKDEHCVLEVILDYIINVKDANQKAIRIINRILRNSLCLERIILMRIPSMIVRKFIKSSHQSFNCLSCSSNLRLGESFFRDLNVIAESGFGYGVMQHLLESGFSYSEKVSAAVAATLLIRSSKGRRKIFLESDGLSLLFADHNELSELDKSEAANGLALLSSCLNLIPNNDSGIAEFNDEMICRYATLSKQDDEINGLYLRASDGDSCLRCFRDVLASKSEVFDAMLNGRFVESRQKEIVIQNVSFKALTYFIHYMHSCRPMYCRVLDQAISRDSAEVFCDVLSLADRYLMFDMKRDIVEDVISRQKQRPYSSNEIIEIYSWSRMANCSELETWSLLVLLTNVYDSTDNRQNAFRSLILSEGLTTRNDVQKYLTDELLKSESDIFWANLREELYRKFM